VTRGGECTQKINTKSYIYRSPNSIGQVSIKQSTSSVQFTLIVSL